MNINTLEEDKEKNPTNIDNIDDDFTQQDYEDYRKSLIFYRECPACHFIQGMIFLGAGFFTAVRMQFIWQSLNWKQISFLCPLSLFMSSLGVYKFTYAYHIFNLQGRVRKFKSIK